MAGPPGAIGPLIFKAIRALDFDLPEDFVTRLEPGLDGPTKASLEVGMRTVRRIRRLWRWTLVFTAIGAAGFFMAVVVIGLRTSDVVPGLLVLSLVLLGLGAALFFTISAIAVVRRRDLHRLEAFAKAMRGSSLARDIA